MEKTVHGVVHGNIIHLSERLGVADGEEVEVVVKVVSMNKAWGEGLRRCAGALAGEWAQEDDRILEQIHQERKQDARLELPG